MEHSVRSQNLVDDMGPIFLVDFDAFVYRTDSSERELIVLLNTLNRSWVLHVIFEL